MVKFLIFLFVFLKICQNFAFGEVLTTPSDQALKWAAHPHPWEFPATGAEKRALREVRTGSPVVTADGIVELATHSHKIGTVDRHFDNPKFTVEKVESLLDLEQI